MFSNHTFNKRLWPYISKRGGKVKKLVCIVLLATIGTYAIVHHYFETKPNAIEQNNYNSKLTLAKRLPQAIIVGCRKSGTRALLKFLELNPAVRAARKEVHFFDKPHKYRLGESWYREQMPHTKPNELTIEKSPSYFVTKNVGDRIKKMNSTIKLIMIFRDPVTRLISDFSQLIANKLNIEDNDYSFNHENDAYYYKDEEPTTMGKSYLNVEKLNNSAYIDNVWFVAEKELENYILRPDGGINDQRLAIRIGMYSIFLEKWLSIFRREQFHFVDGEKLIADPTSELQKLEKFLGLKPYIKQEHFVFDSKKGFFCINGTILMNRKFDYNTQKSSTSIANFEPHCLSKSKGRRHVKVGKHLVDKLRDFYEPYNQYLYSLTGINFEKL